MGTRCITFAQRLGFKTYVASWQRWVALLLLWLIGSWWIWLVTTSLSACRFLIWLPGATEASIIAWILVSALWAKRWSFLLESGMISCQLPKLFWRLRKLRKPTGSKLLTVWLGVGCFAQNGERATCQVFNVPGTQWTWCGWFAFIWLSKSTPQLWKGIWVCCANNFGIILDQLPLMATWLEQSCWLRWMAPKQKRVCLKLRVLKAVPKFSFCQLSLAKHVPNFGCLAMEGASSTSTPRLVMPMDVRGKGHHVKVPLNPWSASGRWRPLRW